MWNSSSGYGGEAEDEEDHVSETPQASAADTGVIAVIGATGQQGGATARALLNAGAKVRALVRDPRADAAIALEDAGAELVQADVEDVETLRAALTGMGALFAMTTFAGRDGTEGEVRRGGLIADAARDVGVPHVVYGSVGGAERHTGIPHFESKRRVEERMTALGLHTTFVRPTFFMENFASFFAPKTEDGVVVLRAPLAPGVPLQMVAVDDIGAAAAAALFDPTSVSGGAIEIAGDELTGEQVAAAFGDRAGLPARFEPLPLDVLADDPDQHAMFTWFTTPPAYRADIAETRRLVPELKDFRAWLGGRD
jgi:uncharacterized protein YbjT (DUF2867 family)